MKKEKNGDKGEITFFSFQEWNDLLKKKLKKKMPKTCKHTDILKLF